MQSMAAQFGMRKLNCARRRCLVVVAAWSILVASFSIGEVAHKLLLQ